MSWPIALLGAVFSGILTGLSFAPFNFHFIAWLCLVPLLLITLSYSRPFLNGLFAGIIANLIIFWWIWPTFNAARIGFPVTLFSWVLLSLVLSLYFGIFSWAIHRLPRNFLFPWACAAIWVVLEHVRSLIMTGFPWALLSQTQATHLPIIQVASFTGAAGISFLVVAFNAAFALMLIPKRKFLPLICVILLMTGIMMRGMIRLRDNAVPERTIRVAVLQGDIDQYQKWDKAYEAMVRERYETLLTQALAKNPEVVVWPESAVPGWIPNDAFYWKWVQGLASQSKVHHLIGSVTSRGGNDFNALFHVGPGGALLGEYDKIKLVPFGEYIPFGGFFKGMVPYLGQLGTFAAGTGPVYFTINGLKFSASVCYEAIFPFLIRESARHADILVNVTNDGWFLNSGAPEQHYRSNILRAIENGKPVIRAANTGISAIIDGFGRTLDVSHFMEKQILVHDVPIFTLKPTRYQRWGEWFTYLCWIFSLTILAFSFKKKAI